MELWRERRLGLKYIWKNMILKLAVVSKEIKRRILMKSFDIILNCSTHERQKITLQLCNDDVVEEVVIVHSADDNFEVDFNIGSFKSSIKSTKVQGWLHNHHQNTFSKPSKITPQPSNIFCTNLLVPAVATDITYIGWGYIYSKQSVAVGLNKPVESKENRNTFLMTNTKQKLFAWVPS